MVSTVKYASIMCYYHPHRTTSTNDNNRQTVPGAFGHICRPPSSMLAWTPPSSLRRPWGRPPLRWADQITKQSLYDAVLATHDKPSCIPIVRDGMRPATQVSETVDVWQDCVKNVRTLDGTLWRGPGRNSPWNFRWCCSAKAHDRYQDANAIVLKTAYGCHILQNHNIHWLEECILLNISTIKTNLKIPK